MGLAGELIPVITPVIIHAEGEMILLYTTEKNNFNQTPNQHYYNLYIPGV